MSGASGPGKPPTSIGGLLGRGAGVAWRMARGRATKQISAGDQGSIGASLGSNAGKTWRSVKGTPGRNLRIFRGIKSGASAFWGSAVHAFHVLFLELSGVVFLSFTLIIVGAFLREYRKYTLHQSGLDRVVLAGVLSAMFLYFGVSSFWRARRKRSQT